MNLKQIIKNLINSRKDRCIWCAAPYDKEDHYCRTCGSKLKSQKEKKDEMA